MSATLVIFGATGDLAKRKLYPALAALKEAGKLAEEFAVVGVTRRAGTEYFQMDLERAEEYARLAEHLEMLEEKFTEPVERLYYLAVPPASALAIVRNLGTAGLLQLPGAKLLLEKPFGIDLASAESEIAEVAKYAAEEQVYRVDHYLAKTLAERIVEAQRVAAAAGHEWNNSTIRRIEIIATETIGIEGRAAFYEQVGVLGDVVQSHLMELLALVLMQLPAEPEDAPTERLAALAQLAPSEPSEARRAQYESYCEDVGNAASIVPTSASLTLHSTDPRWLGVEISIEAGKAFAEKRTEVRIIYTSGEEHILSAEPETFPSGYARIFLAALHGEHEMFTSSGEVLASWSALDALMQEWRRSGEGLESYPPRRATSL